MLYMPASALRPRKAVLSLAILAACLSAVPLACATFSRGARQVDPAFPLPADDAYRPSPVSEAQRLVTEGGRSLVGKQSLVVNGITYPADCTGVVRAAYAFAAIDLAYKFNSYSGNGVRRIYSTLVDSGLLYAVRYPAPADLIFWNNTYDANGNGKADDELTHVGLVLSVDPDGSISYLHYHYRLGPTIERMNLTRPDDESRDDRGPLNAAMRMRGSPGDLGTNAAQLFRVFGKGYGLSP